MFYYEIKTSCCITWLLQSKFLNLFWIDPPWVPDHSVSVIVTHIIISIYTTGSMHTGSFECNHTLILVALSNCETSQKLFYILLKLNLN